MYKFIPLLLLLCWQAFAVEKSVSKQNFAYVADIQSGQQSVRQFELPYEVLSRLNRTDYGDMRIFNAQNQLIPFTLKVLHPQTQHSEREYSLPFFNSNDFPNWRTRLRVDITPYHSSFHFKATTRNWQKNHLIIQNPYHKEGLKQLEVLWNTPLTGFSIQARLEQSDDMQNWRTVNNRITFYDLKRFDAVLIKNTIKLSRRSHAKFLRLTFKPASQFSLTITKITGSYRHKTPPQYENWKNFELQAGEQKGEWLFDTHSFAPVAKVSFEIPQQGLLYQGNLFSKPASAQKNTAIHNPRAFKKELKHILRKQTSLHHKPKDWYYRGGFTQYRLQTESGEISSQPFSISANRDRFWRIVLSQPLTLLPEQIPKIKLAWFPVMVTFLAQGNEPYQLFFGNSEIKPLRTRLSYPSDIENIEKLALINLRDSVYTQQQSDNSASQTFKEINWKKVLLWFLLSGGVLLMAVMAYKLYLGMNDKS